MNSYMALMPEESGTVKKRGISRRKRIAIILAAILIISMFITAVYYILRDTTKYYTMEEIMKEWSPLSNGNDTDFEAGETIHLKDELKKKGLYNSTYGLVTILWFDGGLLLLFGDKYDDYKVGSEVNIDLNCNYWYYNGIKYLWIDEISLALIWILVVVEYSISYAGGILLEQYYTSTSNTNYFDVALISCSFSYNFYNLTIHQTSNFSSSEFHWKNKDYLDQMDKISPGTSRNGYITYNDFDNNGNLTEGDMFVINNIDPTNDGYVMDSYVIRIDGMLSGLTLAVNWHEGFFGISFEPIEYDSLSDEYGGGSSYSSKWLENTNIKAVIEIKDISQPLLESLVRVSIRTNQTYISNSTYDKQTNTFSPSDGKVTIIYEDKNDNGLIDNGDLFIMNGTKAGNEYYLVFMDDNENTLLRFNWIAGEKHKPSCGLHPYFYFSDSITYDNKTGDYNITIDSAIGQIQGITILHVFLYRNDELILKWSSWGHDYTYPEDEGIVTIIYYDNNNDSEVSDRDRLAVRGCVNGSTYRIEIYDDWDYDFLCGEVEWLADEKL